MLFLRGGISQQTLHHQRFTLAFSSHRSVTVTLGAHNIKKKEDTWQRLEVIKQFPYPKYDPVGLNDIMFLKVQILLPLLHSLFSRLPYPFPVLQASFPALCSPGFLPISLFSRTSPTGPITLTLSQPASHQHPSAQPLEEALIWSSCPVPLWLPPPVPKPIFIADSPHFLHS